MDKYPKYWSCFHTAEMAIYLVLSSSGVVSSSLLLDLLSLLLLCYVIAKVASPVLSQYRLAKQLDAAAGPAQRHWFYGHVIEYQANEEGFLKTTKRPLTHPTMFNQWFAPFASMLQTHHPDTAISLLASGAPKSQFAYEFLRPWIGDGLLTSRGGKWRRSRHLLTPAFHFNILKGYAKVINQTSQVMLDKWQNLNGKAVEVSADVGLMTLDTMLQCAMSSVTNCQNVRGHPYITAVHQMARIIMMRAFNPRLIPNFLFRLSKEGKEFKAAADIVHKHAEEIIAERRHVLQGHGKITTSQASEEDDFRYGGKVQLDFLDILLQTRDEDGKGLTDSEIRDEVDTFLFEGHDTTASGISWALYNLAKHPAMQERCRTEAIAVEVADDGEIEIKSLARLQYLTMFLKESMRLYPPVFGISRRLEENLTLRSSLNKSCETVMPKGSAVALRIFALHRDELVWENPHVFDPERFTPENISKRSPHAYLPFSAGSGNCIGRSFAVSGVGMALARTLRRYRLYLDDETPTPIIDPRVTLQSKNGIHIKFQSI